MAAMVSFFSSFCAVRKKSTSPTSSPPPEEHPESNDSEASNDQFAITNNSSQENRDVENEDEQKSSLPLPPGMMNPVGSSDQPPNFKKMRTKSLASFSVSASKKHILHSASAKKQMLTSLSMKVMQAKREKEFKHEDSLWKKRIILGEKCRISHDDDTNADENGYQVPTYYRRVSCSVPVSRQSSFRDDDAIPKPEKEDHAKQIEGEK